MTIIETLVTCALLGILFGIVSMTLRPGLAAWRRSQVRGDLQGNALLATHALTHAISHSRASGVTLFPRSHRGADNAEVRIDSVAVVESDDETAPSGAVTVFYAQPETRELWQAQLDAAPADEGSAQPGLPPTVVTALESGQGVPSWIGHHRRVSRFVHECRVEQVESLYRVQVETEERELRCRLESAVTPILEALGPPTRRGAK